MASDNSSGNGQPSSGAGSPGVVMQPVVQQTLGTAEYGLIALQSMLWGSTFFFVSVVKAEFQPWSMSVVRLTPAVLLVCIVVLVMRLRLPGQVWEWVKFLPFGLLNNALPFVLIARGQQEVTGGIAAIFNATAPLFTIVFAHLFLADERMSWRRVIGFLVGLAGIGVLTGLSGSTGSALAQAQLLLAASCYAIGNVYARRFLVGHHPFSMALTQMILALLISVVAALALEAPWQAQVPSQKAVVAAIAMGIFGSALASLCHFTVLKRAGATNSMLVTIILPVTPIVLGMLFLGEVISLRELAGAAVIALALVIIDGRLFSWLGRLVRRAGGRGAA